MSKGSIGWIQYLIHKLLDYPFRNLENLSIIEVGSGNSEHLSNSSLKYIRYLQTDIRCSDFTKVDNQIVTFLISDAEKLSEVGNEEFDLLVATCLLAHLSEMYSALENWSRVVRKGGSLAIYVPCEPSFVLRTARYFTTKRKIRNRGFDHDFIHWREHRNHYLGMNSAIRRVFRNSDIKSLRFPFPFLPWDFNLFQIYWIRK